MTKNLNRSRMKGLTLIELLISLVIGLVVVGAVIVSMIGSGKAGRFQEAYSQMNEDAQIALSILSRDLQMAGYSQPSDLVNIALPAATPSFVLTFASLGAGNIVFGCDTGFANPSVATVACGPATVTTAAIEVAYEADLKNTVPQGTPSVPSDCLGNGIPVGPPYIARNRYYLSVSTTATTSGRPELYCASNNVANTGQPLVENIEDMKILYGVAVAAAPTQVVRYVTAAQVATVPDWGNVISVRVCLQVRSAEPVLAPGGEDVLTYLDCAGTSQTSVDGYLRRAYFSTSALRDRMP